MYLQLKKCQKKTFVNLAVFQKLLNVLMLIDNFNLLQRPNFKYDGVFIIKIKSTHATTLESYKL